MRRPPICIALRRRRQTTPSATAKPSRSSSISHSQKRKSRCLSKTTETDSQKVIQIAQRESVYEPWPTVPACFKGPFKLALAEAAGRGGVRHSRSAAVYGPSDAKVRAVMGNRRTVFAKPVFSLPRCTRPALPPLHDPWPWTATKLPRMLPIA